MASDCSECDRICIFILRNGGIARVEEIAEGTGYTREMMTVHIIHLLDNGQLQVAGDGRWRLVVDVASERFPR